MKTLVDLIQNDINRSVDVQGPDWLGILYAEQLRRELDWVDAVLAPHGGDDGSAEGHGHHAERHHDQERDASPGEQPHMPAHQNSGR